MLLAVDPGLRGCGVGLFNELTKSLVRADYVKGSATAANAKAWRKMAEEVWQWTNVYVPTSAVRVVIELPQVYQRQNMSKRKKGTDPNDLIQLAAVVGGVSLKFEDVTTVLPAAWKGQVPKEVMWGRALKRLSATEVAIVPPMTESLAHNMRDGIMLGLVALGRLGKFTTAPEATK